MSHNLTATFAPSVPATVRTSSLGVYEGYAEKTYDGYRMIDQYVAMDDGCRLAVTCLVPTRDGRDAPEPLPALFEFTPYGRAVYSDDVATLTRKPLGRALYECYRGKPRRVLPCDLSIGYSELVVYGYVIMIAEVRGTGASFGYRAITNSRREAQDGAALVEWLARQPYCNGKVGMVGMSYTGGTQYETISQRPEHLVASVLGCTDYDKYDGWIRGGVPRAFGSSPDTDWGEGEEGRDATVERLARTTVPVASDPDGVLLREAIREHSLEGSQLKNFAEGVARDYYCAACGYRPWLVNSARMSRDSINASGTAIYFLGGTHDVFRRDTLVGYHNTTTPKKLTLGPWYHIAFKENPSWKVEIHRWMDYWLKGVENGVMDEKPLAVHVGRYDFENEEYQTPAAGSYLLEERWPVGEGSLTRLWCAPGGVLVSTAPAEEHACGYQGVLGITTSVESRYANEGPRSCEEAGLRFATLRLERAWRVVGHPCAQVAFTLDAAPAWCAEAPDVDVFVTLADFDPVTGRSFLVSDGHLRASMRATAEPPYDFLGLPWHESLTGSNRYMELGTPYVLDIDLMPIAYEFAAGHELRMSLTVSCDRMSYLGKEAYEADDACETAHLTFRLGGEHPTMLTLPDIYA